MTWAFSFLFPFLLVTALLQGVTALSGRTLQGRGPALVLGLIGAGIVLFPVGGLPLARWLIGFNANFSIPLTAILFSRVVRATFGIRVLDDKALLTCWIFAITAGAALYPMALGLGRWDPYAAGWEFSWLFILLFFLTVVLLIMKNRFAMVLMAVILAYHLRLLESTNLWDYLVDPFLVVVSCIGLGGSLRRRAGGARRKGVQD
ncbi:MAG: hypothetical protein K9N21_14180 [Deltaproteobacteria bacterium]|nr:hypothetical protein [Deltaproteobacteria bacterium]